MNGPTVVQTEWTPGQQRMHSLYWSAFLGLPSEYETSRFDKRYNVSTAAEVVRALLGPPEDEKARQRKRDHESRPEARRTLRQERGQESRSAADPPRLPPLRPSFVKLALWALAPRVLSGEAILHMRAQRDTELRDVAEPFREAFRTTFRYEPVADRGWDPDRLLVPEMPDLGIEGVRVETRAFQRAVRVRVQTDVLRPFTQLRHIVQPSRWGTCLFWTGLPTDIWPPDPHPMEMELAVRLPGGDRVEKGALAKERLVKLDVDLSSSAFEARIDYCGTELPPEVVAAPEMGAKASSLPSVVEIDSLSGFLQVEKLAGRPGSCRVTAEREASFVHPNHDHFRAETVHYWLASELVGLVEDARTP